MKVTRGDVIYLKKVIPAEDHIQGGVRPYVVVSNDKGNLHSDFCMAVPLTSKGRKAPLPTHTRVTYHNSLCLCEQIVTVPQNDVREIRYHLPWCDMKNISRCLSIALGCGR